MDFPRWTSNGGSVPRTDSMSDRNTTTVYIRKSRGWIHFNLSELWAFRDLFWLLIYRDYSSRFKQTILGPAWYVVQPLLTTLIFTVIFGNVAKIPTDGIPTILFYLCGLLAWNYHANIMQTSSNVFQANMHIFGKVYFPRILVPFSTSISQLIGWVIQFLTFFSIYAYFMWFTEVGERMDPQILLMLFPLLVLQTALTGVGTGLWLSSLTAKYRDLQHLQSFLVQAWMYLTPLVYPLSSIPENWRWVAVLNPMTMIVENAKFLFFGAGTTSLEMTLASVAISCGVFLSGWIFFNNVEKSFIDIV
jgi:lipopolysaccharide transport system permease protein